MTPGATPSAVSGKEGGSGNFPWFPGDCEAVSRRAAGAILSFMVG